MVAGVCAGLGKRLDIDPLLLRIVFGATTLASGLGLVGLRPGLDAHAGRGRATPAAAVAADALRTARNRPRRARGRRSASAASSSRCCSTFRELGLPFSDALTWPLVLVAAGGALIWRQSVGRPGAARRRATPAPAPPAARPRGRRGGAPPVTPLLLDDADAESRPAVISRIGIGVTLVIAAAIVFLQITGALAAATDVALAAIVVAIALVVIFAPFFVRLADVAVARARRADPLAGARRGRRAPARLGAADARARAEARRRPARRSPRSPAARSASCARG